MFKETLREGLIFISIAFAPVWAYIAFCLLRGICDDMRRFIRFCGQTAARNRGDRCRMGGGLRR